ncbi:hypothetical protein PP178_04075 [Zeaxanthinibacter sp. PT1]|uniref:DUF1281 family ferredoxin-like fold protein n=1 Tax=Zeaxanthinibacter TaxID=561554 RepID=UPI00234B12BC|nr:hypothetical protein [Zeaxanthinibacter sp. PT1]MDC6350718.1 hypothetical protein [Zeaxanthinibacter sp. PT1]
MANHCINNITIIGSPFTLSKVKQLILNNTDTSNKPENFDNWFCFTDATGEYMFPGLSIHPCDEENTLFNEGEGHLLITGTSKWGPPEQLLKYLSHVGKCAIETEYDEPGMLLYGRSWYKDNEQILEIKVNDSEFGEYNEEDRCIAPDGRDITDCETEYYEEVLDRKQQELKNLL